MRMGQLKLDFRMIFHLTLYKTVLHTNNKEVPAFSFDRIIYKQKDMQARNTVLYFASSENLNLLKATVETTNLQDFNYKFYQNASVYPEYLAYPVNKQHQVFVLKNQFHLIAVNII